MITPPDVDVAAWERFFSQIGELFVFTIPIVFGIVLTFKKDINSLRSDFKDHQKVTSDSIQDIKIQQAASVEKSNSLAAEVRTAKELGVSNSTSIARVAISVPPIGNVNPIADPSQAVDLTQKLSDPSQENSGA